MYKAVTGSESFQIDADSFSIYRNKSEDPQYIECFKGDKKVAVFPFDFLVAFIEI